MKIQGTPLETLYINIFEKQKHEAINPVKIPDVRQKAPIAEIGQALKTVSATYNHEINNALAPIMMIAQLYGQTSNDPELKKAMEIINSSAQKIASVTKELENKASHSNNINLVEYLNGTSMIDIG